MTSIQFQKCCFDLKLPLTLRKPGGKKPGTDLVSYYMDTGILTCNSGWYWVVQFFPLLHVYQWSDIVCFNMLKGFISPSPLNSREQLFKSAYGYLNLVIRVVQIKRESAQQMNLANEKPPAKVSLILEFEMKIEHLQNIARFFELVYKQLINSEKTG